MTKSLALDLVSMLDLKMKAVIGSLYSDHHSNMPRDVLSKEMFFIKAKLCGLSEKELKCYEISNQFVLFDKWVVTPRKKWRKLGRNKWYSYTNFYDLVKMLSKDVNNFSGLASEVEYNHNLKVVRDFIQKEVKSYAELSEDYKFNLEPKEWYTIDATLLYKEDRGL